MQQVVKAILRQLFLTPATNKFPTKYAPLSTIKFLERVKSGQAIMVPPIAVPPNFRGKVFLSRNKCIGCQLCVRVCPTKAMEFLPKEKKVKHFVARCCFCSQCVEICPVDALNMTNEFLLSNFNKFAPELVITDSEKPAEP